MTQDAANWFDKTARLSTVRQDPTAPSPLRRAQLGAAWAIAAAFTSGRPEAALAVLPTGTGKSAVLTLIPLLHPPRQKLLVATPNRIIRDQLADEFRLMRQLKDANVLDASTTGPAVRTIDHRPGSVDDWLTMTQGADVIVGTMGVLSPAHRDVVAAPRGLFDLILVDEAHHVPAPTWTALMESLPSAAKGLLTATPVRLDQVEIPAELVFSYRLADALRDGIISPISFIPVEQQPDQDRDSCLAAAAVERLNSPEHLAGDSRLIVRAGGRQEADDLVALYSSLGASLDVVTADTTPRAMREVLRRLDVRETVGLVSIGVLGEGFNEPRVKIAVYHRKHKSLPATLQFVGRISRTNSNLASAEFLAIRDEDLTEQTRELYEVDADWSKLLPRVADAALEDERARRRFMQDLRDLTGLPDALSAAAIRVPRDVLAFRVDPSLASHRLNDALPRVGGKDVVFDRVNATGRLRAVVTYERTRPDWLASDALDSEEHHLAVAVLDEVSPILYVHARSDGAARSLAEALGFADPQPARVTWLTAVLAGMDVDSYFSVGMRSARQPGGLLATYRMMAGTSIGGAITPAESLSYAAGHLILRAKNPFGDRSVSISVGFSMRRAKVWSPGRLDLLGFYGWCQRLGKLSRSPATVSPTGKPLALRLPQELKQFPDIPIAAMPDPRILAADWNVHVGKETVPITAIDFRCFRTSPTNIECIGEARGLVALHASIGTDGRLTPGSSHDATTYSVQGSSHRSDLLDGLNGSPFMLFFSDGSSSTGGVLTPPSPAPMSFPEDSLKVISWAGVDVRCESKTPKPGLINVNTHVANHFASQVRAGYSTAVINDDGAGEIADLIVLQVPNKPALPIYVSLVHCKFAGSDSPRRDLQDIEQVIGQATRSARWVTNMAHFWRELDAHLQRRAKVLSDGTGSIKQRVSSWASTPPETHVSVAIAQPGLSCARVAGWQAGEALLTYCLLDLSTVDAAFEVIGAA
ncbi:DEAD/DEAH box helicase [Modestobacter sp. SSW1-42]|uniref:DEAD/DEAH box helicase n=1 Tax=Modestobacter sp. SSW1-42 TaxID=596372 RepID=UPI003985E8C4